MNPKNIMLSGIVRFLLNEPSRRGKSKGQMQISSSQGLGDGAVESDHLMGLGRFSGVIKALKPELHNIVNAVNPLNGTL